MILGFGQKILFMNISNIENKNEYDIYVDVHRKRGISSMMRVGNEEEFIEASILSTIDFFDEIIIVLNNSTDNTENIVSNINSEKIKIYHYPFKLRPNGPGHKQNNPENSIYSISYYYNWCMSKTSYSHICKWDGDNVALSKFSELKDIVLANNIVWFKGVNIVGKKLDMISKDCPHTGMHPSFHIVNNKTQYKTGDLSEVLNYREIGGSQHKIEEPIFLHYKACKSKSMQTRMWPDNWKSIPHFRLIYNRSQSGSAYKGEQPKQIKKILKRHEEN